MASGLKITAMPRKKASDLPPGSIRPHYIKQWRIFRKRKQKDVAAEIGEKPSSLSQLENGRQGYTQWKLETLARIYRTDPVSLLSIDPTSKDDVEARSIWRELSEPEKRQVVGHMRVIHGARADVSKNDED